MLVQRAQYIVDGRIVEENSRKRREEPGRIHNNDIVLFKSGVMHLSMLSPRVGGGLPQRNLTFLGKPESNFLLPDNQ